MIERFCPVVPNLRVCSGAPALPLAASVKSTLQNHLSFPEMDALHFDFGHTRPASFPPPRLALTIKGPNEREKP